MLYVIGLGNPGEQFTDTPHNIGWQLAEELVRQHPLVFSPFERNNQAMISRGTFLDQELVLIRPLTYMNNSGRVLEMYDDVTPEQVVVVYDDIDLPFGDIKLSRDRGDGGHNGIKSIEQHLRSRDFIRIRVGVCPTDWFGNPRKPQGADAISRYLVKRTMSSRYTKQYSELAKRVYVIVDSLVHHGYQKTVSQHQR